MTRLFRRALCGPFLLTIILILGSCASTMTFQDQYVDAQEHLERRDYTSAALVIEDTRDYSYKEKDRVLYYLDVGMLYHFAGDYEKSNAALEEAERGIEDLYTESISKAITSGILNDNALAYAGEDYEDIYLNVFKGLNYIALGDPEAAMVEMRRIHIKLNLLEDKYRKQIEEYNNSDDAEGEIEVRQSRFHNDALARYLGLLLYRYERSFDDARIESEFFEKAFKEQKQIYDFEMPALPDLEMEPDSAYLNVLAFSGNSPRKLAETLFLTTIPGAVIITTAEQDEDYVERNLGFTVIGMPGLDGGFHFKFEYPRMQKMGSLVDKIVLIVDGERAGELTLLEKMEDISREIFLIKQPLIMGKSIIRSVVKGVIKETSKQEIQDHMSGSVEGMIGGFLIGIAADVAVDATENADLRISQYFPAFAHGMELKLPPGEHDITLEFYDGDTLVYRDMRGIMDLQPGQLNLIESFVLE